MLISSFALLPRYPPALIATKPLVPAQAAADPRSNVTTMDLPLASDAAMVATNASSNPKSWGVLFSRTNGVQGPTRRSPNLFPP